MEMDLGHCWDCPLDIGTALVFVVVGLPFLFFAVRLYSSPSMPVRLLGGGSAAIALLLLATVAKYVGTHGLSASHGAIDLPYYTRFLFLAGLIVVSAAVALFARRRRTSVEPSRP